MPTTASHPAHSEPHWSAADSNGIIAPVNASPPDPVHLRDLARLRKVRDRIHRERRRVEIDAAAASTPLDALDRYASWRRSRPDG